MTANYLVKFSKLFTLIFILFFLNINNALCKDKPLVFIPVGDDRQSLNVQLEYLDDPQGTFTIDQVANGQAGVFKPLKTQNMGFGYKGVMWIRFTLDLSNYPEPNFILNQNYEHVGDLKLFYPASQNESLSQFNELQLSEHEPAHKRMFTVHNYLFKVPTSKTPTTYYMRFAPEGHALNVDLSWSSTKGIIEYTHNSQLTIGLFFGGLAAMFFYNLVICVYLRSRVYFYYIYYLGCLISTLVYLNGFVPLIVQINPFYERLFAAFAYGMVHGMTLFARHFLSLNTSIKWLDNVLRIIQWAWLISGIGTLFIPMDNPYIILNYLMLVTMPFLITAGLMRWYQDYLPARLYCAGWIVLAVSLAIYILVSIGILPINWMTNNALQIASIWEAILFALALAYRLQLISLETAKAKNAFLAMVSHELSTPLQRIVSAIDLMALKGINKIIGVKEWKRLVSGVEHLEMQMKDLKDYARLGSGTMQIRKTSFNPSQIISEISENLTKLAQEKGLEYHEDIQIPPGQINSDALRFQQIINNLCINAIKYTETGYVTLRVRYDQSKAVLIIQVADSGIGIETKNIKRILEPFTQVDVSSTRKHGGLGMGLAIVQQLVNLLEGELYFDSVIGQGTNVEVRIPAEIVEDQRTESSHDNNEKVKVLLVDDTEDVRIDLKQLIENLDCYCDVAASGEEAINLSDQQRFDVILLDINMPVMDGFSAARAIRQSKWNRNTPLVWISGNDPKSGTPEQRKLFSHFLEKPIRIEKLEAVLIDLTHLQQRSA